ncbi:MAG: hypothetical protein EBQ64_05180 [Acidimicrobiia bacterium]|nr:hypothetical protein [Acidimicrobiia bacterium]
MDYLRVAIVIAPQFLAGCLIYLLVLKRSEVDVIELVSIGSVFGIVSSTIIDQIFVNLQLPHIGWQVAVFLAVVSFLQVKRSKKFVLPRVSLGSDFKKSVFAITAISATALGTEWFWLFPSGVLLVIASSFLIAPPKKYSRIASGIASVFAAIAGIFMIASRPKIWWFMYEHDFPFFQALSRSLSDWGLRDYVLLSGTTTKYHWFTYAWIGLIDRASGAQVFFVLTKVAPAIFVLLITAVSWSFIKQFSKSTFKTYIGTLLVMTASTYPLWGYGVKISFLASPSQFFATSIFFVAIHLLTLMSNNLLRLQVATISIFAASTMLSKTMHGVVLISALAFAFLGQFVTKTKISKKIAASGFLAILIALLTYFLLVSNSEGENVLQIRFGDFFWQLQGDARLLPEKYVDLFGLLTIVSFSVLPILLITLRLLLLKKFSLNQMDFLSIGGLVSGALLSVLILSAYGENLYFLQAATSLSILLSFSSLSQISISPINLKWRIVIAIVGIIFCSISFLIPSIDSGAQDAIIIRSLRVYTPAVLIISFSLIIIVLGIFRREDRFNQVFRVTAVAAVMSISFSAANWFNAIERKHNEFARDGETYLANKNLTDVTDWMNSNSANSDIVASNFGWPRMLPGDAEHFRSPCTSFRNKEVSIETCRRTSNALLVAYMHRRTWLQTTALHYTGFTPEIDRRQTVTLGFAADPTSAHLQQMVEDGVDWFVVDRLTTSRATWEPYATIEYTNDSFFVLRLNKHK